MNWNQGKTQSLIGNYCGEKVLVSLDVRRDM